MKIDVKEFEARVKTGAIKKFEHPTERDTVGWCYTQKCQYNKMWDEHTILARGIVTTRDGDVVSRPFPKFFNLGEIEAEPTIDRYAVEIGYPYAEDKDMWKIFESGRGHGDGGLGRPPPQGDDEQNRILQKSKDKGV